MTKDDGAEALDDIDAVYGIEEPGGSGWHHRKREFKPWHLPVKQLVREYQWLDQTTRLIKRWPNHRNSLRYLSLPGPDLLDVRVLAKACAARKIKVNYLGFDSSFEADVTDGKDGSDWVGPGAELRQAGLVSGDSLVLKDRVESLAIPKSQSSQLLEQRGPFDVVNLDVCGHFGYRPNEDGATSADALRAILAHQITAKGPWLLFLTTRVDPSYLNYARELFEPAISSNLNSLGEDFRKSLSKLFETDPSEIESAILDCWTRPSSLLHQLFTIGLGKYLLQFFHGQLSLRSTVELKSLFVYRVAGETPDMVSLAFCITPTEQDVTVRPPTVGGEMIEIPLLEESLACQIVTKSYDLWDLDRGLADDSDLKDLIFESASDLIHEAGFDRAEWANWVKSEGRQVVLSKL
jgi:hypothetical protein